MKFKFRASAEDLMKFIAVAILLFFVIAMAVSNILTFAEYGRLSGLNPLPALMPEHVFDTLIVYLLCLAGLFVSVKSYFFEREKGFGITTEKKDKGYSRWAKEKEIKEELERVEIKQKRSKVAGVPLVLNKEEMWVDNSEYHSLVIGATGSGKTQTVILPLVHSLAKARESMIITDPKGEIYEKTSNMLRKKGYQILLLNFRDPQNGNAWNPLDLPYKMYKTGKQDKAIELLDDLALNILYDDSNKNADPFWEKTSADYFSGVALGLFEDAKPEEININSISLATTIGEEKFGASTYIKEYFAGKDPASAAAINASSTIMAPSETKGSILSVFKQKVKLFASRENLSEMLSHSDIDLESIGERPTAVFIVIQDEKKTYHSLVTILLKQIYETLIAVAQRHGGKLPVRTNFLLDEFANMPPLKDVTTMITAARSRAIRFTMIIQNFAQLDSVYGKEDAETIRGNCGNIIYLITTELKALEEISKMCGEVKSKKDDKTASTPLVTVSDLQRMKQFEVIILRIRKQPFKTKFTPYFQLDWGEKYPPAKYPSRRKIPVQTFDIKEFVKNQKKKKLLEMMNSADGDKSKLPSNMPPIDLMKQANGASQERSMPDFLTRKDEPAENKKQYEEPIMDYGKSLGGGRPSSPSFPTSQPTQPATTDEDDDFGFNVDELIKKIDAKIAEIEAEEKKSKETVEKFETKLPEPVISEPKVEAIDSLDELTFNPSQANKPIPEMTEIKKVQPTTATPIVNTTPAQQPAVPKLQTEPVKPAINLDIPEDSDDDDFFDDFFDN